jgi:hypothetical protein
LRDESHKKEAKATRRSFCHVDAQRRPGETIGARTARSVEVETHERIYLAREKKIADNKREESSRKTVKCRVLAAHPLATARGFRRRSSVPGLPTCAFSCG